MKYPNSTATYYYHMSFWEKLRWWLCGWRVKKIIIAYKENGDPIFADLAGPR